MKISGDALYGGDFDRCFPTLPYSLNGSHHHKHYSHYKKIFKGIFDVKQQQKSSKISSDPRKVCFCTKSPPNKSCNAIKDPTSKYPGQGLQYQLLL